MLYIGNVHNLRVRFKHEELHLVMLTLNQVLFSYKDPYTSAEQEIFGKCLHQCSNHIHKNMNTDSSGASYCTLKLFHDKRNPDLPVPVSEGHISKDGHHFDCVHSGSHHIVFVIDKSGSMNSSDKKPEHR